MKLVLFTRELNLMDTLQGLVSLGPGNRDSIGCIWKGNVSRIPHQYLLVAMEDIVLFKQGWKWLLSESHCYTVAAMKAASFFRDKIVISIARHWPSVCHGSSRLAKLLWYFLIQWKDCFVRGSRSLFGLGTAALLVIIWSCFLSLTSMSCLFCVLLSMVSLSISPLQHFLYLQSLP